MFVIQVSYWNTNIYLLFYKQENMFARYIIPQNLDDLGWIHSSWKTRTMMTSSNGNIFRVTGPLWGEFTGHRWIRLTKASDAELWYVLSSAPEQTME